MTLWPSGSVLLFPQSFPAQEQRLPGPRFPRYAERGTNKCCPLGAVLGNNSPKPRTRAFRIHQSCSALNDPFAGEMTRGRQKKQNSEEGRPSGADFKWQLLLTLKKIGNPNPPPVKILGGPNERGRHTRTARISYSSS